MRVADEDLWARVAARLGAIAASPVSTAVRESRFWERRRPGHMLTRLAVCGCCGHKLAAVGRDYLRCARAHRNGLCDNTVGVRRGVLEDIVVEALKHRLMQPDLVAEFIEAFLAA
nr:zinc ribbon domain-containing protein [Alsobacter ponti]